MFISCPLKMLIPMWVYSVEFVGGQDGCYMCVYRLHVVLCYAKLLFGRGTAAVWKGNSVPVES